MKTLKSVVLAALALLPIAGFADSGPAGSSDVAEFYTINDNDKSAQLLEGLIGPAFNEVTGFEGTTPVQDVSNNQTDGGLLGVFSEVLTRACLVLTVIIMGWGWFTGTAAAAYEGRTAHRRYNTLWVPLRSVTAFGMLVPWAGGYCAVQVVIMKLALLGIGVADAGYQGVLRYVNSANPIGFYNVPRTDELASNLLASEICRYSFNQANTFSSGTSVVPVDLESGSPSLSATVVSGPSPSLGSLVANPGVNTTYRDWTNALNPWTSTDKDAFGLTYASAQGSGVPTGYCGVYTATQTREDDTALGSASLDIFKAKAAAFNSLRATMDGIAAELVPMAQPGSAVDGPALESAFSNFRARYNAGIKAYQSTVMSAASTAYSSSTTELAGSGVPAGASTSVSNAGWIMAGGIYWNLAATSHKLAAAVGEAPDGVGPDIELFYSGNQFASTNNEVYRNSLNLANSLFKQLATGNADTMSPTPELDEYARHAGQADITGIGAKVRKYLEYVGLPPLDWFVDSMVGNGDFVTNMQSVGQTLFSVGTTTIVVGAVANQLSEGAGGDSGRGVGLLGSIGGIATKIPGAGMMAGIAGQVAHALWVIAPLLIIVGFVLGFYLPFVPLFMWIVNVIGWMTQVLKALVAAPVWAAAHSIPEGEGIAGQHAREGYMLVLSLVLRPLLLVIGLFLGMLVLEVSGKVCALLFPIMVRSVSVNSTVGIFSSIAFMGMFAGLLVTLAHKSFALSHEVADEILRWIGGGVHNLGDAEAAGSVRTVLAGQIGGRVERGAQVLQRHIAQSSGGQAQTGKGNRPTDDPSTHINTR